jgi:ABC-type glycerol-3-phosphate transport system substrate-binding protein
MDFFKQTIAAAAIAIGLCVPAFADATLHVHYPMPGFFQDVMDVISKKSMEENPDIRINFANPSATYEEGGDGNEGIDFRWQGDDWIFSAMIFGNGGAMLSPDEKKVAVNDHERLAVNLIGHMVKEGGVPVLTKQAAEQAFLADKVGISLLRDDC